MRLLFTLLLVSATLLVSAQVEIDKHIELTGSASDARLSGIESVLDADDATNKAYVDSLVSGGGIESMDQATRDALSPTNGQVIYNTTSSCLQIYFPIQGWADIQCDCSTPPDAGFTYVPLAPSIADNVTFTPNTVGASSYAWIFPGGSPGSSSSFSPTVSFTTGGTYDVILTVTDADGCTNSDTSSISISGCLGDTDTLFFTGSMQTYTLPACATNVTITCYGAQGTDGGAIGYSGGSGGLGGMATGTINTSPGATLYVYVGGQSGYNGGAAGGTFAGNGGGASDVRIGGTASGDRVIVAGGGGGGGQAGCLDGGGSGIVAGGDGGAGGGGSGVNGGNASNGAGGLGGTLGSGGAIGPGCTSCGVCTGTAGSSSGTGGTGPSCCCASGTTASGGGGGGGYVVGGGGGTGTAGTPSCSGNSIGGGGGGAGGSNYTDATMTSTSTSTGVNSGNGYVIISY